VIDILGPDLDRITVERAVIGLFFTGIKLSAGVAGTCATPRDAVPSDICCPISARTSGFQHLAGRPAAELMQGAVGGHGLARAVGIATLNALAELCWRRRPCPGVDFLPGTDAFDATRFAIGDRVVLVGAFVPFLKELKRRGQPYLVLEQNPAALKPEEMPFYRPAELAPEIVPEADVLLITGATLLTDTLEDLLALARPTARVTVLGPTVGMLPDAFLARGADILGSVRISRPDEFLDLLAEGGSAPHFLGRSAEKVVLARQVAAVAKVA
ncbi:MAG: Rossmann-like domain-containing protein, partial [Gemmatimonadales bacterium]